MKAIYEGTSSYCEIGTICEFRTSAIALVSDKLTLLVLGEGGSDLMLPELQIVLLGSTSTDSRF